MNINKRNLKILLRKGEKINKNWRALAFDSNDSSSKFLDNTLFSWNNLSYREIINPEKDNIFSGDWFRIGRKKKDLIYIDFYEPIFLTEEQIIFNYCISDVLLKIKEEYLRYNFSFLKQTKETENNLPKFETSVLKDEILNNFPEEVKKIKEELWEKNRKFNEQEQVFCLLEAKELKDNCKNINLLIPRKIMKDKTFRKIFWDLISGKIKPNIKQEVFDDYISCSVGKSKIIVDYVEKKYGYMFKV